MKKNSRQYRGAEIVNMKGEIDTKGERQHYWVTFPWPHQAIDFKTLKDAKKAIDKYIRRNGSIKYFY